MVAIASKKLKFFSTHRKTKLQARYECLHLIKVNFPALWLDKSARSEFAS